MVENRQFKNRFDRAILRIAPKDPVTYEALKSLGQIMQSIEDELHPVILNQINSLQIDAIPLVPIITDWAVFPDFIRLRWQVQDVASRTFEVRKGLVWETAEFELRTSSNVVQLNPVVGLGIIHTYLVKSINNNGVYSVDSLKFEVIPGTLNAPIVTAVVIDNNVLLTWSNPFVNGNFKISHYELYRNTTLIGTSPGNFVAIFETTAGLFTYKVKAVDIAGNVGIEGTITVFVNQPPDFELFSTWESIYAVVDPAPVGGFEVEAATFNNTFKFSKDGLLGLLGPVDSSETWQQHYVDNAWASPQAQITAGYPIYIQPGEVLGDYIEQLDYGTVISNVIVNVDWTEVIITGNVIISIEMSHSLDASSWSSYVAGFSQFIPSFRYLRVKVKFTGGAGAIKAITHLTINLDVKREVDSGEVVATASDVGGTTVNFVKDFKDVDSITLTIKSLEAVTAIYDFVDTPNPTSFKVLAFDGAGNRITYPVSWKARGIV